MTIRIDEQSVASQVEHVKRVRPTETVSELEETEIAKDIVKVYLLQQKLQNRFQLMKAELQDRGVDAILVPETEEFLFEEMQDGDRAVFVPTPEMYEKGEEVIGECEDADVV